MTTKTNDPLRSRHGKRNSRVYRIWTAMMTRCTNPKSERWEAYGAKGVLVCESWRNFRNFYADMGDPPPGMSIDRIDVLGNYEPANCRWATARQQAMNTRHALYIEHHGLRLRPEEWSARLGIPVSRIYGRRCRYGNDPSKVLFAGILPTTAPPPDLTEGKGGGTNPRSDGEG